MSVNVYDGTQLKQIAGLATEQFVGTKAQWEALTTAQKKKYRGKTVTLTDDYQSGLCSTVESCVESTSPDDLAAASAVKELAINKSSSVGSYATNKVCAYKCGNLVNIMFFNVPISGTAGAYTSLSGTLGIEYRPQTQVRTPMVTGSGASGLIEINTDGTMRAYSTSAYSDFYCSACYLN